MTCSANNKGGLIFQNAFSFCFQVHAFLGNHPNSQKKLLRLIWALVA